PAPVWPCGSLRVAVESRPSSHVSSSVLSDRFQPMQYRFLLNFASVAALASLVSASAPAHARVETSGVVRVTVFKDPNCGCCRNWVEHLRKHGFAVAVHDTSDV